jgi:PAS domain S-box-containing protein
VSAEPIDSNPGVEPALAAHRDLRAEQLRLYAANTVSTVAGSVVVAVLLVLVLWDTVATGRLLGWLACLALALCARLLLWLVYRREAPDGRSDGPWLTRMRLGAAGVGAIWGLAGVLLFPAQDLQQQVFLAFVLAGMAAGSLTVTAFDPVTALAFAALTLAPLSVRLLASGGDAPTAMAAMALLFMAFLALTAVRAFRNVRDTVVLRGAETARADTLIRSQRQLQQLSEQLGRKTDALELTLDSMAQGILSLGSDGRANFYNRRLLDLLDLPESLMASAPTMEEIARYQAEHGHYGEGLQLVDETARPHVERWLAGEQARFPEVYFRRTLAGLMLEVKTRYLPGGGLVRTFSDVTAYFDAQQRLQQSEARLRKLALVAAYTDNAVWIADAELRIEWVNEGFTRLTGYRLDEAAGRKPGELLRGPGTDPVEAARLDERLSREPRSAGELVNYAKDGRAYWVAVDMQAILDDAGRVQNYISIERDITAHKHADEALRSARDEAERANQAKSEFLSAMSHELRTPMNAILGFGQLLESDTVHRLPERQTGYVHEILNAGRHLLELIDDVLDLTRIEAGKQQIDIEPVAVAPLVEECLSLVRPAARERRIVLPDGVLGACDCLIAADRTRLKQVLLNLLSNAIKYNRPGGRVQVSCGDDDGALRISVTDTGHGLSLDQRERLFKAFERLGAERGAIQGVGIGLVLSKRLVELMHGSIGLDSTVGEGSTFWVRLARAQPAMRRDRWAGPHVQRLDAAPFEGTRTVLYIEDNPVNVLVMEAMLAREPGVRLITATLPHEGLQMARAEQPQLILLDIQLPGIDGFEVLRRLRADESTRAIPVIAISANAMRGDIEQGLAAGFTDYLTKPLDLARLLTAMRAALHG